MIRRHILAAAASLASLVLTAPPLAAQDRVVAEKTAKIGSENEKFLFLTEEEEAKAQLEQELAEAFSVFGAMFKADPLTPEQEARLPFATEMAGLIMPEGSFRTAMRETMDPMMAMITGDAENDPRVRLAQISGVEAAELERLSDTQVQEVLDIFDPQFAARYARTNAALAEMIGKLLEAVEPAYREGLARALARRFDEAEMRQLLTFFATPLGGKFASQSFLVQFDPQVMGVMEAMGPAAVKLLPEMTEEFAAIEAEFGAARDFTELSSSERTRAARLIGKSVNELEALVPEITIEDDGAEEDPVT